MRVDQFDFELPESRIALRPARPRDAARLLHAPLSGPFEDRVVRDATGLFRAGDLLVFNDARVIRARLNGVRLRETPEAGAVAVPVEATLHQRLTPSRWSAFAKPGKRLRVGDRIRFGAREDRACLLGALDAELVEKREGGEIVLAFDLAGAELDRTIDAAGEMPLPPYIAARRPEDDEDARDYQTIYATSQGAVAAPTAGLHFTEALMRALDGQGVERRFVTLDVGAGTFLPVKAEDTAAHKMHAERRVIDAATAASINRAKAEGRRIIAIGTTSMRTLESAADEAGRVHAGDATTDIFITPGYRFRVVDGLWTNFHLPRSTLFMLVSAFIGLERAHAAYAHAIAAGYRFYSYGDACLFWRASN
ncbi:MAG: tRNA preQ1(34) S-adenosylmethionine ribosyltransferase-isomerase QueA [Hyphomonadaceae bacterium]|nr:tRNA preQ1(34) S-adenosylmethionine ribosyltransferase-isomerase QueA [Hyphomonadaceae bacterium]